MRDLFDFGAMDDSLQGLRRLFREHCSALTADAFSTFDGLVAKAETENLEKECGSSETFQRKYEADQLRSL